jgi:hypothetical protein
MTSGGAIFAAMICAIFCTIPVEGIVVRHDVDESKFLALAEGYGSVVAAVSCADGSCGLGAESTLIDARWLLTAAHVATGLKRGDPATIGDRVYRIDRVVLHPDWRGESDIRVDIALVHLAEPVTGIVPVRLYTDADEVGLAVTFVGRGGTGTGLTGPVEEDLSLRAATNRVESLVFDGSVLRFRFDAPDDADVTELEGISGPGDSGGPAFLEREGVLYVVGVGVGQNARPTNGRRGHYGVLEFYTRVSTFAGWIRSVLSGG